MWNSVYRVAVRQRDLTVKHKRRPGNRSGRRPTVDVLEGRQLLASLQSIPNLVVPAEQGYTQPLLAENSFSDPQTFAVTSSNSDIVASIVQGQFWSINVSYTDPNNSQNDFTGTLTSQLFESTVVGGTTLPLAPKTVAQITNYTEDGYYTSPTVLPAAPLPQETNPTKTFDRIIGGVPNATDFVLQGGGPTLFGTGNSGQSNTPFDNENLQQLAFTGSDQLGMANIGVNTNDSQFFFTTGAPNSELGYNYTVFGQLVSGQSTLAEMTQVPVTYNLATFDDSLPVNNVSITGATLSSTNPNGVLLIDTTQAKQGETATITVTATDSVNQTTTSQSFVVTVGAYAGATSSGLIQDLNFKPYANPTTASTPSGTSVTVSLAGQGTFPVPGAAQELYYSLVSQPSGGTVSDFNTSTGTFVYTPASGFVGTDSFQYQVASLGPNTTALAAISNPADVTITVTPPLVTVSKVRAVTNAQHEVVQIFLTFSGAVNATEAQDLGIYQLTAAGKGGSFTGKGARNIPLKSAVYTPSTSTVLLKPRQPFLLKRKVQLQVDGVPPSGLEDSFGRYIDGANSGQPGSNADIVLS